MVAGEGVTGTCEGGSVGREHACLGWASQRHGQWGLNMRVWDRHHKGMVTGKCRIGRGQRVCQGFALRGVPGVRVEGRARGVH